jgi:hypothetical protein
MDIILFGQRFARHCCIIANFFPAGRAIAKPSVSFRVNVAWLIVLAAFPSRNGATLPAFNSSPFGLNVKPSR